MNVLKRNELKLGENLRKLMRDERLTLTLLSKELQIAPSTLFNYRQNVFPRKHQHLHSLCKRFSISSDELLFGSSIQKKSLSRGDVIRGKFRVIEIEEEF